jgi:eukaryotic-like serine/threonine-protein kinase
MSPGERTEDRLDELLLRWDEARREGEDVPADRLCGECPELAGELARRIRAVLATEGPLATGPTDGPLPPAPAPTENYRAQAVSSAAPALLPRYHRLRFHARGGLGEVYVAHDAELNRDVALKEMQGRHAHDPVSRARFLAEAEVTGGLEHPGIVPVYGLGRYTDGRLYYAMRLIRDDDAGSGTLKEAIRRFHESSPASERAHALRKLVRRFVDVCNAIAYAHSRGVLHRDIKPANILLGPFGETLVVDWGLARPMGVMGPPGGDGKGPFRLTSVEALGATQGGLAVGTPGFMSPEQAAGDIDRLGPASDVYSLGATLYCLVTGRALVEGAAAAPLELGPSGGASITPRSVRPDVPRALEAICRKAMAPAAGDRYRSAQDLAEEIERWLADERVTAYAEPLPAQVRRWARRHQRLVGSATATALVGVVALVALVLVVTNSNNTIRNKNDAMTRQNQALEESNRNLAQARAEALAQRDQALEVTGFLVSSFRKPDPAQNGRKITVAEVLGQAVKELEGRPNMVPSTRAAILAAIGETYYGLALFPETVRTFERSLAFQRDSLGEDHPEALTALNNLAEAYIEAGQYDRAIPLHERAFRLRRANLGDDDRQTLLSKSNLAGAYLRAGHFDRAIPLFEEALHAMRAKLGEDDLDTLGAMNYLARAYGAAGQLNSAISLHSTVLMAVRAKLGADHPHTLLTQGDLAAAYAKAGQLDRAIPLLEEALEVQRAKAGADHPYTLIAVSDLAQAYNEAGRRDRALELFEQTLPAEQAKLGAEHPHTLRTMSDLAGACADSGQLDRALFLHVHVLEALRANLGEDHPNTLNAMSILAGAYLKAGRIDRAIPLLEQALLSQRGKLGEDHPDALHTERRLAQAYEKARRYHDAVSHFRRTVQAVARSQPRNDRFYSDSLAMLAHCLIVTQKYVEAVPLLRDCLRIKEQTQPDDWTTANVRSLLGEALAGKTAFLEAEPLLLAGRNGLAERRATIPAWQRDSRLRQAVDRLIRLYEAWDKPAQAIREARHCAAMSRGNAALLFNVACGVARSVPLTPARAQEALAAEAVQTLKEAVAAGWKDAGRISRDPDLAPLRNRGDFRRLLAELFDRGIPADPFAQ